MSARTTLIDTVYSATRTQRRRQTRWQKFAFSTGTRSLPRSRPCSDAIILMFTSRSALLNVLENAVELFQRVVVDHELALAGIRVLNLHLGTQLLAQIAFELANVRIGAPRRFGRRRRGGDCMRRTSASVSRTDSFFFATSAPTSAC